MTQFNLNLGPISAINIQKFVFIASVLFFVCGQAGSISFNNTRISLLDIGVVGLLAIYTTIHKKLKMLLYLKIFLPFLLVAVISLVVQINRLSYMNWLISSLFLVRFALYTSLIVTIPSLPLSQKQLLKFIWLGGVSLALVGLGQYILYPNLRNLLYLGWDPHQFRVFSTMLDPNFTGILMVLALILGLLLKNHLFSMAKVLEIFILFLAFLLTFSRGAYISLITMFLLWSILNRKLVIFFLFNFAFILTLLWLPKPSGEGVNLLRELSIRSRISNDAHAISLIQQSPFIGQGFNTLRYTRKENKSESIGENNSHSGAGFQNSWLFILATTGIIGLFAYIWMWKVIFVTTRINQLILYSAGAVFVHSLFDNSLFFPPIMYWLFTLIGVGIKLDKLK